MKKLLSCLIVLLILPLACRSEISKVGKKLDSNAAQLPDQNLGGDQSGESQPEVPGDTQAEIPPPSLKSLTFNGGSTVAGESFSKSISIFPGESVFLSCNAQNATNGDISFISNHSETIETVQLNSTAFPDCASASLDTSSWIPGKYTATVTSRDDNGNSFSDTLLIEVKPRVQIQNVRVNGLRATIDLFYQYGVSVGKVLVNGTEVPVLSSVLINRDAGYTHESVEVQLSETSQNIITAEVVRNEVRGPDDNYSIQNTAPKITSASVNSFRGCRDAGESAFGGTAVDISNNDSHNIANWAWQDPATFAAGSNIINQVDETTNSRPTIILSNQNVDNTKIEGFWKTTGGDDDFWGVIFGYQNTNSYYLFDWKGGAQSYLNGDAPTSARIRKCTQAAGSDLPSTAAFWHGVDSSCFETKVTATPASYWQKNKNYRYEILRETSQTKVLVWDDATLVVDMTLNEATPGNWGIYSFSQAKSIFWNLKQCPLSGVTSYQYTVTATDTENDQLEYILTQKPDGMIIDSSTGMISWEDPMVGSYQVSVQVNDKKGGIALQSFTLAVL